MTDEELHLEVESFQNALVAFSTGGGLGDANYTSLRKLLLDEPRISSLSPRFLKVCRTPEQFWQWIKYERAHYHERRELLWNAFRPMLEKLEGKASPADEITQEQLKLFDENTIHELWQRALVRRDTDAEGAITLARTLIESTCKHILEKENIPYSDDADLPELYKKVRDLLQLSPEKYSEEAFKRILGGCISVVEGLGSLRNKFSDAHGTGLRRVRPSKRHAELAVNLSGTMATFIVATYGKLKNKET